jgi:predicted nucleotide-binding protein
MRLLRAIYEKTGGRNRGVRDVTELEIGLTADESRAAWRDLVELGLIERFSIDYAARLSVAGVEFMQNAPSSAPVAVLGKVFIVHGHGTAGRGVVAEFVEQLGFETIPLHGRDEQGRTVMEQANTLSEVGFAIVLLTPEDLGVTGAGSEEARPRLNVLLELGYFLGRLGQGRVCALVSGRATELPTDLAGAALTALDALGEWKNRLARDLRASLE